MNQAPYPLARIKVRLVIADAYDVVLGEKIVYCGNLLTDAELGALAEAEIQRELSIPTGERRLERAHCTERRDSLHDRFQPGAGRGYQNNGDPGGADRLP